MFGTGSPLQTPELIIEALAGHPLTEPLQNWGIGQLRGRSGEGTSEESRAKLMELGTAHLVLEAMRNHSACIELLDNSCAVLGNLARGSASRVSAIWGAGGVELVLKAMKSFPDAGEMQGMACFALRSLAFDALEVQEELIACDAVDVVIGAVGSHPHVRRVQGFGCAVLGLLATRSEGVRQKIADQGGIDNILYALQHHAEIVKVQGCGWATLGSVLCKRADWRFRFVSLGGIELVLDALRQHPGRAFDVQVPGLGALSNITLDPEHAEAVVDREAVELIASAMHAHPGVADVQLHGILALQHLVAEPLKEARRVRHQERIVRCVGCELILRAMTMYMELPVLQAEACEALRRIAVEPSSRAGGGGRSCVDTMGSRRLADLRADEALLLSMRRWPALHRLQRSVCGTLRQICDDDASSQRVVDAEDGIELIVTASATYSEDVVLQADACETLRHLSRGSELRREMVFRRGGGYATMDAVQAHFAVSEVQNRGVEALDEVARIGPGGGFVRARLTKRGLVEVLLTSLRAQPASVSVNEAACRVLANLLSDVVENQLAFLELGGGGTLVAALRYHAANAKVVSMVSQALTSLSAGGGHVEIVKYMQYDEELERFRMEAHDERHGRKRSEDPRLVLRGRSARRRATQTNTPTRRPGVREIECSRNEFAPILPYELGKQCRVALIRLNTLEAVCACLGPHLSDAEAQRSCIATLWSLSYGCAQIGVFEDCADEVRVDALARIVSSGGAEACVHSLQRHCESDPALVSLVVSLLRRLCHYGKNYIQRIVGENVIEVLARVVQRHLNTAEVQAMVLNICFLIINQLARVNEDTDADPLSVRATKDSAEADSVGSGSDDGDGVVGKVDIFERMHSCGFHKLILKTMQVHEQIADVQGFGCALIASFSRGKVDFREELVCLGCIPLILRSLQMHLVNEVVQAAACEALETIASEFGCKPHRETLLSLRGLEELFASMRTHPTPTSEMAFGRGLVGPPTRSQVIRETVNVRAAAVVRALICDGGEKAIDTFMMCEGMKLLMVAMSGQPENEALLGHCIQVVSIVIEDREDARRLSVEFGLLDFVIITMRRLQKAQSVQYFGCSALHSWVKDHPVNRQLAGELGAIEIIVKALDIHRKTAGLGAPASAALDQLLFLNRANQAKALKAGATRFLILACQTNAKDARIQERCIACLWHMANDHAEASEALAMSGGGMAILTALKAFPDEERLQYCGCGALACIAAAGEERRERLVRQDAMPLVLAALKKFLSNQVAVAFCLAALYSFIRNNSEFTEDLLNQEGLELVGATMRAHPRAAQVQLFGGILVEALKPTEEEYIDSDDGSSKEEQRPSVKSSDDDN